MTETLSSEAASISSVSLIHKISRCTECTLQCIVNTHWLPFHSEQNIIKSFRIKFCKPLDNALVEFFGNRVYILIRWSLLGCTSYKTITHNTINSYSQCQNIAYQYLNTTFCYISIIFLTLCNTKLFCPVFV